MFDLTRITELAGGWLGQSASEIDVGSIVERIGGEGFDPSMLQNMDADQIMGFLGENGIDPSQLDPAQLGQLVEQLGVSEIAPELLSKFTDRAS